MRILITGGAGFIGSHLVERLIRQGHQVVVVDNLTTGSLENLSAICQHPNLKFHRGDVRDKAFVDELTKVVDSVIHLAAIVGVGRLFDNPEATYQENIEGCRTVFEAACRARRPILFSSSSEVYGTLKKRSFTEIDANGNAFPDRPRYLYGRSKFDAERILESYSAQFQTPARALRFFNVVGPRQSARYGMVIPRFVQQALEGRPITVFGDGTQSRCFASVQEVADCVSMLIPTQKNFDVLNLGNPNPITIQDLALKVKTIMGSDSPLEYVNPAEIYGRDFDDFSFRAPDLSRLNSLGIDAPSRSVSWILENILQSRNIPAIHVERDRAIPSR